MKKLLIGLLALGFTTQFMFSQEIELSEVYLDVNYQYLDAIASEDVAESVQMLEKEVAYYDLKESDLYNNEYDKYRVSFFIPEGHIIAAYNKVGKIIRTTERFKNIKLPKTILRSILEQYPNWEIVEDAYEVDYTDKSGIARKQYKVKLMNGKKKIVEKFDENGEYL